MRHFAALSAIVALAAVVPAAQPPQNPAFRSGADVVRIDASVLDKNRVPVRGLSAADFVVREEGKPRPVVAISEIVVPALAPEPRGSAVRSNWTTEVSPENAEHAEPFLSLFCVLGVLGGETYWRRWS